MFWAPPRLLPSGVGAHSPPQGPWVALETCSPPALLCFQAQRHISDLYEDLRDGHNLISLLEVLSGDSLVGARRPPTPGRPSFLGSVPRAPSASSLASPPPHLLVQSVARPGAALPPTPRHTALLPSVPEP